MVELTGIEPAAAFGVVRRGADPAGGFAPRAPGGRRFDPAAARRFGVLSRNSAGILVVELTGIEPATS
jgi:hypothetical protein